MIIRWLRRCIRYPAVELAKARIDEACTLGEYGVRRRLASEYKVLDRKLKAASDLQRRAALALEATPWAGDFIAEALRHSIEALLERGGEDERAA